MPGVLWRETIVSEDMVDPLNELARLSGDDIYVKPIKGYGSYADNSTSADIDEGGGHVDLNLVGLNDEQKKRLERIARELGFYADIREPKWWSVIRQKWLYGKWQSHLHMVKKDTPDRSIAARAQLAQWYAGSNGLAGFIWNGEKRYDPDDGPREFLNQTWSEYKKKEQAEMVTTLEMEQIADRTVAKLFSNRLARPGAPDTERKPPFQEWFLGLCLRSDVINQKLNDVLVAVNADEVDEATIAKELSALMMEPLKTALTTVVASLPTEPGDMPSAEEIADATVNEMAVRFAQNVARS